MFNALLLEKSDAGFSAGVRAVDDADLPEGDVLVSVAHSTLNYKDGLAITNKSPVVRAWPMVAGIDGSGTVLESSHPNWKTGDAFIHNGWGLGETRWGCLAQKARLKGDWLVKRPAAFGSRQAMAIGTAGYTAMLCVMALERHGVKPGDGEVLVTGATGGVPNFIVRPVVHWMKMAPTHSSPPSAFLNGVRLNTVIACCALRCCLSPLS